MKALLQTNDVRIQRKWTFKTTSDSYFLIKRSY